MLYFLNFMTVMFSRKVITSLSVCACTGAVALAIFGITHANNQIIAEPDYVDSFMFQRGGRVVHPLANDAIPAGKNVIVAPVTYNPYNPTHTDNVLYEQAMAAFRTSHPDTEVHMPEYVRPNNNSYYLSSLPDVYGSYG